MPKELYDEIAILAGQLREQLQFYREIGVTDIGGAGTRSAKPAVAAGSTPLTGMRGPGGAGEDARIEPPEHRTQPPLQEDMPRKSTPPGQAGLFGDAAADMAHAVTLPVLEPQDASLEAIREDLGECVRCKLHEHRTHIVFGEGDPNARIVFVGEGPGADEDATGRPFIGKAGQLLDKIIAAIGLKREQVYIANIVKCRPPGNRTPERDETSTCEQFLFRQLAFIRPQVIVALGSPAFQTILRTRDPITRARGEWRDWNGVKVMPTFHPAYLLRVPEKKREAWEDMKKVRDYLNSLSG
jgi:DNA polymerase